MCDMNHSKPPTVTITPDARRRNVVAILEMLQLTFDTKESITQN